MNKDIILILWGGGMMGIFTAWVLKVINRKYRNRIHSIYGCSSWADVWVYLVSDQTAVPYKFFTKYLTRKDFIRKNMISYLCKVLFFRTSKRVQIPDFVNIDYVVDIAKNSECKIDYEKFINSGIPFFVKVINVDSGQTQYLDTNTQLFEKLKASSNTWPLSSQWVTINGSYYIDWDTLRSSIDLEIIKNNPDKTIIFVESSYRSTVAKVLLYPLHLLAGLIIWILYSKELGKKYVKELFVDHCKGLSNFQNVIHIKNKMNASIFCTNIQKLTKVYEHGIEVAERETVL